MLGVRTAGEAGKGGVALVAEEAFAGGGIGEGVDGKRFEDGEETLEGSLWLILGGSHFAHDGFLHRGLAFEERAPGGGEGGLVDQSKGSAPLLLSGLGCGVQHGIEGSGKLRFAGSGTRGIGREEQIAEAFQDLELGGSEESGRLRRNRTSQGAGGEDLDESTALHDQISRRRKRLASSSAVRQASAMLVRVGFFSG